jgi:hypothetical protein
LRGVKKFEELNWLINDTFPRHVLLNKLLVSCIADPKHVKQILELGVDLTILYFPNKQDSWVSWALKMFAYDTIPVLIEHSKIDVLSQKNIFDQTPLGCAVRKYILHHNDMNGDDILFLIKYGCKIENENIYKLGIDVEFCSYTYFTRRRRVDELIKLGIRYSHEPSESYKKYGVSDLHMCILFRSVILDILKLPLKN